LPALKRIRVAVKRVQDTTATMDDRSHVLTGFLFRFLSATEGMFMPEVFPQWERPLSDDEKG
jgi:hypothetical protein